MRAIVGFMIAFGLAGCQTAADEFVAQGDPANQAGCRNEVARGSSKTYEQRLAEARDFDRNVAYPAPLMLQHGLRQLMQILPRQLRRELQQIIMHRLLSNRCLQFCHRRQFGADLYQWATLFRRFANKHTSANSPCCF